MYRLRDFHLIELNHGIAGAEYNVFAFTCDQNNEEFIKKVIRQQRLIHRVQKYYKVMIICGFVYITQKKKMSISLLGIIVFCRYRQYRLNH